MVIFYTRISRYLREARTELMKVNWPTRQTTLNHATLVIVISLALAAFLGAFDFFMNFGLERLLAVLKS